MNTTVQALLELYVSLGGKLTDSYPDISDGVVGDYTTIPDCIKAVQKVAKSGSSLPPVTASDNGKVLTVESGKWGAYFPENEVFGFQFDVDGETVTPKYGATFDLINNALRSHPVQVKIDRSGNDAFYCYNAYVRVNKIIFSGVTSIDDVKSYYEVTIDSTNTCTFTVTPI